MKHAPFLNHWQNLLHWKGWGSFAGFCVRCWKTAVRWSGWKRIFSIPSSLVLTLTAVCIIGLVFVFTRGLAQWIPACFLYTLSTYCLIALCTKIPSIIRRAKMWLVNHPKTAEFLANKEKKLTAALYLDQIINFAYGIFKIVLGILLPSAWIGADGIYNLMQAIIQLFQILRRKHPGSLEQQWRSYRDCGGLILLMHLTLTGLVFQMVNWNRAYDQGEILVIITAVFAFYKIIASFLHIAKDRKHVHPVDSSVRMLNLAQAIFAIFSLQASMLHTFGTGGRWETILNTVTGCVVCLMVMAMGIYMIRRGNREIRKIQETCHG